MTMKLAATRVGRLSVNGGMENLCVGLALAIWSADTGEAVSAEECSGQLGQASQ